MGSVWLAVFSSGVGGGRLADWEVVSEMSGTVSLSGWEAKLDLVFWARFGAEGRRADYVMVSHRIARIQHTWQTRGKRMAEADQLR